MNSLAADAACEGPGRETSPLVSRPRLADDFASIRAGVLALEAGRHGCCSCKWFVDGHGDAFRVWSRDCALHNPLHPENCQVLTPAEVREFEALEP